MRTYLYTYVDKWTEQTDGWKDKRINIQIDGRMCVRTDTQMDKKTDRQAKRWPFI